MTRNFVPRTPRVASGVSRVILSGSSFAICPEIKENVPVINVATKDSSWAAGWKRNSVMDISLFEPRDTTVSSSKISPTLLFGPVRIESP